MKSSHETLVKGAVIAFGVWACYTLVCIALGACSATQVKAGEAKARACFDRPDVQKCQGDALALCVLAREINSDGQGCNEKATAKAIAECLRVCEPAPDTIGAAGASGADAG